VKNENGFLDVPLYGGVRGQSFADAVKHAETYGNAFDGTPRDIGIYKLVAIVRVKAVSTVEPVDGE
jgi:hypothetical protein